MPEIIFLLVFLLQFSAYAEEAEFPVSNEILFEIWNRRPDLQQRYPDVEKGNFDGLKKWASLYGWKENQNLSSLIPKGEIPDYEQPFAWIPIKIPENADNTKFFPIFLILFSFGIGVAATLYHLKIRKLPS